MFDRPGWHFVGGYDDPTMVGELVKLIRIDHHGRTHELELPAGLAVMQLGHNELNGSYYRRGWIVTDEVDLRAWDTSA